MEQCKYFGIILVLCVITFPGRIWAQDQSYYVQIGPAYNSLGQANSGHQALASGLGAETLTCIDKNRYFIVHNKALTTERAAREHLNSLRATYPSINGTVRKLPANQCYSSAGTLLSRKKKNDVAMPFPKKRATHVKLGDVRFKNAFRKKQGYDPVFLPDTTVRVPPETTTQIFLSKQFTNRLTCGDRPVKDVIISTERGLIHKESGGNVYVKFVVQKNKTTGAIQYATDPAEIYVICGSEGTNYTLIAYPRDLPAQKVTLTSTVGDRANKNHALFKGMSLEEKIVKIMKEAYTGEYPDTYTLKKRHEKIGVLLDQGVAIKKVRSVKIDGEGLAVSEFHLTCDREEDSPIQLVERMFLKPEITTNTVAITLDRLHLERGKLTRLFILEQQKG